MQLRFVARIPIRQGIRRIFLVVRRRMSRPLRPIASGALHGVSDTPPWPVFPPRLGLASVTDDHIIFNFLGGNERVHRAIDWNHVPDTRSRQLWRMNLHYMEFVEELDDAYFLEIVTQWVRSAGEYRHDYAADSWNSYALSIRIVVWMQQFTRRDIQPEPQIIASMVAQLRHLEKNLETDIGGNHLIKNAKALIWASRFFEGPLADRWHRSGAAILDRELSRQILPDGMHFELSPAYHCQVLADLIEVRHVIGSEGALAARLTTTIARMADALDAITHPDGLIALFGDAGLSMAYTPMECLACCNAVIGHVVAPRKSVILANAGYFAVRRKDSYAVVDAGEIAPQALPAHGHGDMFSFEWSIDGRRFVVDQGVFEYVAGARRQQARTVGAHNTVAIPGTDQAEFFGAFRIGRQATILSRTVEQIAEDALLVDAEHSGFVATAVRHRRRIELRPDSIRIDDSLSDASQSSHTTLLLAPEVTVQILQSDTLLLQNGTAAALLKAEYPVDVQAAAWWPDMGIEVTTSRLVMQWPAGISRSWVEMRAL